ncbi:FUSC family protein [Catenulispora yoronensis]|uniref:FUSC family protein n=1 Tax=Catenulispora yoronensis TaxID=450799 RepID=UPI0031D489F8
MREHAGRLLRFQRIEIDVTRLVLSGVALALPVAVGALTHHLADGLTATMGALLLSAAGHEGGWRARLTDIAASATAGALTVWLGAVIGASAAWAGVWIVAVASTAALLGGMGTLEARIAANATVFTVIGAHLGTGPDTPGHILLFIALGMLTTAVLTLGSYAASRALSPLWRTGLEGPPGLAWPFRRNVATWRAGLRTWPGWQFPVRLGSAMAVAEVVAHFRPGEHTYWIALTVSLVVLRDEAAAPMRAAERGLGTTIGVLIGGLLLGVLPTWGMVALIGAIGAVRPWLKAANYTAYAAVMTPLITMLNELGQDMSWAVLRERVLDTLLGCAIGLGVGYLPWRVGRGRRPGS